MRNIVLWSSLFIALCLPAKVDPPNYNFSLDALAPFRPESSFEEIKKALGEGVTIKKTNNTTIVRYYVAHLRYKFPIFIQLYQGKVVEFFARLPSYFLHDIFHQSLINRLGKQDFYSRQNNNAIYIWKNKENCKHTYSGSCTITCFPLYYSQISLNPPPNYNSLIEQMAELN